MALLKVELSFPPTVFTNKLRITLVTEEQITDFLYVCGERGTQNTLTRDFLILPARLEGRMEIL